MKRLKNLSIQKKLFMGILLITALIIFMITGTAVAGTYRAIREQLIYNRRMSAGWLRDRMELELAAYQEQFYEFEVNKEYKKIIEDWCIHGEEMDYTSRWKLITAMNEVISMDSSLNGMKIFNLSNREALIAERSGASFVKEAALPEEWLERSEKLQSNLVFLRTEDEILILHQMHRFSDKRAYALVAMYVRPYALQDILQDIKMTADETVIILNDENEWIEADYGEFPPEDFERAQEVSEWMAENSEKEFFSNGRFWFYREVASAKLKVLMSVPDHVIVDSMKDTLMIAVFAGAAALLLCVVVSILFAGVFSRPIIHLAEEMRHFTLEDPKTAVLSGDGISREGQEGAPKEDCWKNQGNAAAETEEEKPLWNNTKNEIMILQNSFDIMVERNRNLLAYGYQKELEKREAQVHALQAQINPHFMYNVMQVIGGMALNREAPEIYRVTTALGDLMRYCLNFSRETVPLQAELHYLQSYCMLQNERFDGRICLNIQVEDALQNLVIPKLILQPVLENSFHHGLVNKSGEWVLTVKGELFPGENGKKVLVLTVTDNGSGMEKKRLEEIRRRLKQDTRYALKTDAHIGLANVDARIRLMYPDGDYGVIIDSKKGEGTTVRIKMEAREDSEL